MFVELVSLSPHFAKCILSFGQPVILISFYAFEQKNINFGFYKADSF